MKILGVVFIVLGIACFLLALYFQAFMPIARSLHYQELVLPIAFTLLGIYFVVRSRSQRFGIRHVFLIVGVFSAIIAWGHWEDTRHDFGPDPNSPDAFKKPWRRGGIEFAPATEPDSPSGGQKTR